MKARFRKLIDIHQPATRLHDALVTWLNAKHLHFKTARHGDFTRYFVHENDLCCAQSVLMALQDLAAPERENASV